MQASEVSEDLVPNFAPLRRSILISIVIPAVAIQIGLHYGATLAQAIVASSLFPLAEMYLDWRRSRKLDVIAMLSLVVLALSFATSSVGDARFLLVKDSALTGIFGAVFLGSLLAPRPLIYFVSRSYTTGALAQTWDARWQSQPGFRRAMRVLTGGWGIGLLADAVARVVLAATLAPALVAALSSAIAVAVFGGLIAWTLAYVRARRRKVNVPGSATPSTV